jgi:hypothetical protein
MDNHGAQDTSNVQNVPGPSGDHLDDDQLLEEPDDLHEQKYGRFSVSLSIAH